MYLRTPYLSLDHGRRRVRAYWKCLVTAVLLAPLVWRGAVSAAGREICIYVDAQGRVHQVNSLREVPERLRAAAKCFGEKRGGYMAPPEEVTLKGNVREEYMSSALGKISLRWPRTAETLFGRTPQRAMVDAATTVARVLKGAGFPYELQTLTLDWKVVFMDEKMPEAQIPSFLITNCHPAWMTPPANLYIVAQRVAAGCGGGRGGPARVNDAQLSQVLIHEMGHAVEYALLKGRGGEDRMRAEGFASWFEQYGSDFSAINTKGAARRFYFDLARQSFRQDPSSFTFHGSPYDYARASMYFHAVVGKRGVRGLMDVYKSMLDENLDFLSAIQRRMGWNPAQLNAEVKRVLEKGR